jgi:hypothetical protein
MPELDDFDHYVQEHGIPQEHGLYLPSDEPNGCDDTNVTSSSPRIVLD